MSIGAKRGQIGGVDVSPVCLGAMRLGRLGGVAEAAGLLCHAKGIGISTFHCSSEYDSYGLFAAAWRAAGFDGARLIAKVAAPHFGESDFSADAFRAKIDAYLQGLGVERLDVVQWLLRFNLKQEEERLAIYERARDEIGRTVETLKSEGKIGALVSFPYTVGIARRALQEPWCDGLAVYLNPLEQEMEGQVREAAELGKAVVAIRPFAAGRIFAETELGPDDALAHVFGFDATATSIVSASSTTHLDALRSWL